MIYGINAMAGHFDPSRDFPTDSSLIVVCSANFFVCYLMGHGSIRPLYGGAFN